MLPVNLFGQAIQERDAEAQMDMFTIRNVQAGSKGYMLDQSIYKSINIPMIFLTYVFIFFLGCGLISSRSMLYLYVLMFFYTL